MEATFEFIVKIMPPLMSYYSKLKFRTQILLKILFVRLCLAADEAAGRNKIQGCGT
jgi:hypothetical protein